jgi:hypothetical protein
MHRTTNSKELSNEEKASYFLDHPSSVAPRAKLPFHTPVTYLGFPLWDLESLPWFVQKYNARRVTVDDVCLTLSNHPFSSPILSSRTNPIIIWYGIGDAIINR